MKKFALIIFFILAIFITPALAQFVVIVNKDNPISDISKKNLKNIYRLKKGTWTAGGSIHALNLKPDNAVRVTFSQEILKKDPRSMVRFYLKRALSGKGQAPKEFASEAELIKFVASDKGAIGYVSKADGSVKSIPVK